MTSDVRAALEAGDDGFHEIQLNGKQLVFLGMATTLVSVVVFLCGVLVGRGVKPLDTVAQAAGPQVFDDAGEQPGRARRHRHSGPGATGDACPFGRRGQRSPQPRLPDPPAIPSRRRSATNPTRRRPRRRATSPPPRPSRLPSTPRVEPKTPKVEPREAAKPKPAPVQASAAPPAPVAAAPKPTPAPAPAAVAPAAPASASGAIAVQVGAFATRKEADTLAKRLSGRGYAVYVMNPTGDGKNVYRVRVGNYGTADEAQRVSARLTQQENLKPWITR